MAIGRTEIDDSLIPLCIELAERRQERHSGHEDPEQVALAERERETAAQLRERLEASRRVTANSSREE
jgi:hypothetical protein